MHLEIALAPLVWLRIRTAQEVGAVSKMEDFAKWQGLIHRFPEWEVTKLKRIYGSTESVTICPRTHRCRENRNDYDATRKRVILA